MARGTEIKSVVVNYPKDINIEQLERKACRAYAKVLCQMLPPKAIDKLIEKLEQQEREGKA